jgi:hypothetical protein
MFVLLLSGGISGVSPMMLNGKALPYLPKSAPQKPEELCGCSFFVWHRDYLI